MFNIFRYSVFELRYSRFAGFTLLEMLLAIGIVTIIAALSMASLANFNRDKALAIEAEKVLSLVAKARSLTLAAKDDSVYGVHFEAQKAVLFKGGSYNANDSTNQIQPLNGEVNIATVALIGGGADVVFRKLSGATTQSGTITLAAARDAGQTKVITIGATGIAY